ncbi:hypothetical protein ACFV0O_35605 [Kitasatospora sp. NPDC059577]|uniref:hypothetical protein n=1 Tax=Kitasatospora sp. NPDC059577 TaxID=3346873 RepID=UPI0036B12BCD
MLGRILGFTPPGQPLITDASPARTEPCCLLWLRGPTGTVDALPVTATERLRPAGHRLYGGGDGHLIVEITSGGGHHALTRPSSRGGEDGRRIRGGRVAAVHGVRLVRPAAPSDQRARSAPSVA